MPKVVTGPPAYGHDRALFCWPRVAMTTDGQDDAHRYHLPLAAAFVRGRLGAVGGESDGDAIARGVAGGLRLHQFKTGTGAAARAPRARRCCAALGAATLLDVGSGRGAFLWPLLDAMPDARRSPPSIATPAASRDSARSRRGGVARLAAARAWTRPPRASPTARSTWSPCSRCSSTCPSPSAAAREALRVGAPRGGRDRAVARRTTTPSTSSCFDARALEALLRARRRAPRLHRARASTTSSRWRWSDERAGSPSQVPAHAAPRGLAPAARRRGPRRGAARGAARRATWSSRRRSTAPTPACASTPTAGCGCRAAATS